MLIAKNPTVAAKFFNIYMKEFIYALLGFYPQHRNIEGSILGVVKAYYGCVEAQGHRTLHCHMMMWVEGGLNLNEIKDHVLDGDTEFKDWLLMSLDDTISNLIPEDPNANLTVPSALHHPCSV